LIIVVAAFSKQLGLNHYLQVFAKQFNEGVEFSDVIRWHFIEWAEIFFNIPFTKVVEYSPKLIRVIFLIGGIAIFLWTIYLLFLRKSRIPPILSIYLVLYFILMFNWPFYDPRFWVPVLPIYLAIIAQQPIVSLENKVLRITAVSAFLFYFFLGVISVSYFTITSFNHDLLARTQAAGFYKREYEIFFYGDKKLDDDVKSDSTIVHLLQRFSK